MAVAPAGPRWRALLLGWPGDALAAAWGLAEGLLFFIVPDVVFTLTAVFSPRRGVRQVGWVIAGSLLAGAIMYAWAAHEPEAARGAVARVPFVTEAMLDRVAADYVRAGARGPLRGPFSGIPYKAYAVLAPAHVSLPMFLLASVPARAERLLLTWGLFAAVGWILRRWTRRPDRWAVCLYAVYWIGAYAWYWTR